MQALVRYIGRPGPHAFLDQLLADEPELTVTRVGPAPREVRGVEVPPVVVDFVVAYAASAVYDLTRDAAAERLRSLIDRALSRFREQFHDANVEVMFDSDDTLLPPRHLDDE